MLTCTFDIETYLEQFEDMDSDDAAEFFGVDDELDFDFDERDPAYDWPLDSSELD